MQPLATDVAWSVSLLDTEVSSTKMAAPINMPFRLWTQAGGGEAILGVVPPIEVH